jgi:hypothetical protein
MYKLFLDDEREPYQVKWVEMPLGPWIILRDYRAFVRHITKYGIPSFVSFDHDLAQEHYRPTMYKDPVRYTTYYTDGTFKEKTGYDCAKWLCDYCLDKKEDFPEYQVHSMNPVGKQNIILYIEQYKSIHEKAKLQQ